MLSIYDMDGRWKTYPITVSVEELFQQTIPWRSPLVDYQLQGIIRSEISPPSGWQMYRCRKRTTAAITFTQNHTTMHSQQARWCKVRHKSKGILEYWQQEAFFDARVFRPNASSYRSSNIPGLLRQHEIILFYEFLFLLSCYTE